MSGKDEISYAMRARIREEERIEEGQQRRRRRRNNDIKRWTSKLGGIAISILVCMIVYSFLIQPMNAGVVSTSVTGEGNFDKIVVNYEQTGDSSSKMLIVIVEAPNEKFIGAPNNLYFYNRSMDIFITSYIDGFAQPSEHFVLRTEGTTTISCENNISISFIFGIIEDMVIPLWRANVMIFIGVLVITFVGLLIFFIISWDMIDNRWYNSWY
jgi:hypothetical protein